MTVPFRCDECDFTYDESTAAGSAEAIRGGTRSIAEALARPDVTVRPQPDVWSPLEYACHVRDVLFVNRDRFIHALVESGAEPKPMFRDERVALAGYADERPADVARMVVDAGALIGAVLDRIHDIGWDHTVVYNYPILAEHTLRWLAVHTEHEVRHHLIVDIGR